MFRFLRDLPDTEDAGDVLQAGGGVQAGLSVGAAGAREDIGPIICLQGFGQFFGDDGGLVVAAGPFAEPVQRDGDDQVHVGEVPGGSHVSAQAGGEISAGFYVSAVLEGFGDELVGVLVVVKQEGGGPYVLHRLAFFSGALQEGVQFVGHGVVRALPVVGQGKVGGAPQAQVLFVRAQLAAAHQARPRHDQICHLP